MADYEFTSDWFTARIPVWERFLLPLAGEPLHTLEIGSHEGRSALWVLEHMLTHPASTITCVDPWADREAERRFDQNLAASGKSDQLVKGKGPSWRELRCLDEAAQQQANWPWSECALPLHSLAAQPLIAERVLIVENKVNLLTLPRISGAIAMGGLGNGVTDVRYVTWLSQIPIWYWGDLDVDGFEILSRLRTVLPHTKSLLMNVNVLREWRVRIGTTGNGRTGAEIPNLTPEESQAFQVCSVNNLRIEQERIPQAVVLKQLTAMGGATTAIEDGTKLTDPAIQLREQQ